MSNIKELMRSLNSMGIIDGNGALPGIQTNANEVMHTGNAGNGQELVPDSQVLAKEIFDTIPEYSQFLSLLPGYHGSGLGESVTRSVIGDVGLFQKGSEETDGPLNLSQANSKLATGKVTLNQQKLVMDIDISDELLTFNELGAEAFENKIKEKIGKAAARTVESLIINGDTEAGANANINLIDGQPGGTEHYLCADGLRKIGLADAPVNVGAVAFNDLISQANALGDFASAPEECLWLMGRPTYNTFLSLDEFKKANENGRNSTIHTGSITNILGMDMFIPRDFGKANADGKISSNAANNTTGQSLLFWKPAVQYGYGKELQLMMFNRGSKGIKLEGWFYVAVTVIQKKAGQVDSSVSAGRNITLI